MLTVNRGNYAHTRGIIAVAVHEDTHYIGTNFAQAEPHTDLFLVAPGVTVTFEECNLVNCTVPDGAIIIGGNLSHGTMADTGNPERPQVRLLCECEKCACCRQEMQDCTDGKCGWVKDEKGRILHHEMKERFRGRRQGPKKNADGVKHRAENAAALAKWRK